MRIVDRELRGIAPDVTLGGVVAQHLPQSGAMHSLQVVLPREKDTALQHSTAMGAEGIRELHSLCLQIQLRMRCSNHLQASICHHLTCLHRILPRVNAAPDSTCMGARSACQTGHARPALSGMHAGNASRCSSTRGLHTCMSSRYGLGEPLLRGATGHWSGVLAKRS